MGAQTAEANINAGIAAARQIVDFINNGVEKFRVNKYESIAGNDGSAWMSLKAASFFVL